MIASNTPNKLHAIIDASQSACLMLTPEGMILESNQVAREMFGYTETEFLPEEYQNSRILLSILD